MNTNMRTTSPITFLLLVASCFAGISLAQQPGESQSLRQYASDPVTGQPITVKDQQFVTDPVTGQPIPGKDSNKRFDFKFNGGTPRQFVDAVSAQSGLKVNVMIPTEDASQQLPAIDVYNVTIPQLFGAITQASQGVTNVWSYVQGQRERIGLQFFKGFRSADQPPSQDSIWYYFAKIPRDEPPPVEPVTVKVYELSSLLNDYTVDDITTAIKTTWQMLDSDSQVKPEMKFHAQTGLLVVRGTNQQLSMISQVIQQLHAGKSFGGSGKLRNQSSTQSNMKAPPVESPDR